jgi:hypothetical protein
MRHNTKKVAVGVLLCVTQRPDRRLPSRARARVRDRRRRRRRAAVPASDLWAGQRQTEPDRRKDDAPAEAEGPALRQAARGVEADERETLLDLLDAEPELLATRPGQTLIGDRSSHPVSQCDSALCGALGHRVPHESATATTQGMAPLRHRRRQNQPLVGCVHRSPAGMGGLDELDNHRQDSGAGAGASGVAPELPPIEANDPSSR